MNRAARSFRAIAAPAALLLAAFCAAALVSNSRSAVAAPAASAKPPPITISNYMFKPGVLTVARGATVTWINEDEDVHTIKSKDGPETFQSPALETGAHYGFTFHHAGTYHYVCSVHPYMRGAIVVR